jgi:hypothetical protein
MPRRVSDDEDLEPLEDKTGALTLHNKRTERMQRKKATRDTKRAAIVNLTKLPTELILECLTCLAPRDVFRFSFVNRRFHSLVQANARVIGDAIMACRYTLLAQCFPTPRLLSDVAPALRPLLTDPKRQVQLGIHKRPYQHIQSPDAQQLCTCLTCILTWNNLGLVLDFAHWQHNLDSGKPIPMVPRGQAPEWNADLIAQNARIARMAIDSSLWHARILEVHLDSTIRSIKRHAKNKGNKRTHVAMTDDDAASGTDSFLVKYGPPSLEFPYHRDEYYMLYDVSVSYASLHTDRTQRGLSPEPLVEKDRGPVDLHNKRLPRARSRAGAAPCQKATHSHSFGSILVCTYSLL